jgi:DNA repair exonuclease SbcCD ATPase subunit
LKLLYLCIENFLCHEKSELNLSDIGSAIIVGQIDGNEAFSNGTGKSTIFKAIEYVLFNESRKLSLDEVVREGSSGCKITLDFSIDDQIYRICRIRTAKKTSDLSFFKRSESIVDFNIHGVDYSKKEFDTVWTNRTSRTASHTEEDVRSVINIAYKSFATAFHFAQNDFTGLPSATPSNRKKILRDALHLMVYMKLEKLAKDKAAILLKELDKNRIIKDSIGNPEEDIRQLSIKLIESDSLIASDKVLLEESKNKYNVQNTIYSAKLSEHKVMQSKIEASLKMSQDLNKKLIKANLNFQEITSKRKSILDSAKSIAKDLESLKLNESELSIIDFSQADIIAKKITEMRNVISQNSALIANAKNIMDELSIPMPDEAVCKHCRQALTDEHRAACAEQIEKEMSEKKFLIVKLQENTNLTNIEMLELSKQLKMLDSQKSQLNTVLTTIANKKKELADKKAVHKDYEALISSAKEEIELINIDLAAIDSEALAKEENLIREFYKLVQAEKVKSEVCQKDIDNANQLLSKLEADKAVIAHTIDSKKNDIIKISALSSTITSLENNYKVYPDVINSFGPAGIPSIIIQNILDDLQNEANIILAQIKPGLQLSFSVISTKNDIESDDGLEINYFLNGQPRNYEQLSGAMMISVMFSLKIGLAFIMQKMLGVDIRFLLLDEMDQALDKAGSDAFADIIKFFQKDFMILVITHNDRLKDKFATKILVDQDRSMISTATVVRQ